MAEHQDDPFASTGASMRLDVALDALCSRLQPVTGMETVAVLAASGRVVASDIRAARPIPNFDNSAVDGYAVSSTDLAAGGPVVLPISDRIPAGRLDARPLAAGTAARIFTGAMIPDGADAVAMQEDSSPEGDAVRLPGGLAAGANRRLAGEDFAAGALVVGAGTRLKPQHLAGLAAAGLSQVEVRVPLRVAIFSTGNEIREPTGLGAAELPRGCQFDANRPMLAGLLAARGMTVTDLGILPDDPQRITQALRDAAGSHDAILTSGGVSLGEEDHIGAAVARIGSLHSWQLALKPGHRVGMGRIGGKPFFGMPGNPVAVFATFTRLVGPALDTLAGAEAWRPLAIPVVSGFQLRKKPGRREYLRVRLVMEGGRVVARRFARDGSALISTLIGADALAELHEDMATLEPGEMVPILPLSTLFG